MANRGAGRPVTANLYHASSLAEDVAQRYMVIPLDESTPLGTVLRSGGEVWLRSLSDIGSRYPSLLEDTIAAGLASTASLALYGRGRRVIGAMGVAWAQAQAFTDAQKDEVRVVARLAADALGRAQMLEAERAARERTERLQRTMTALVPRFRGRWSHGAVNSWPELRSCSYGRTGSCVHALGFAWVCSGGVEGCDAGWRGDG